MKRLIHPLSWILAACLLSACGGSNTDTSETPTPAETVTTVPAPLVVSGEDRLRIPKIGVDAPLSVRVVGPDGKMLDPGDNDVALYDFSPAWPNIGGSPGNGNTILSAYQYRNENSRLFWALTSLAEGDDIELTYQGRRHEYRVAGKCTAVAKDFDAVVQKTSEETLTLLPAVGSDPRHFVLAAPRGASTGRTCPGGTILYAPAILGLAFEERLPPGTLSGPLSGSLTYRFRLTGFEGSVNPNESTSGRFTISPALSNTPNGEVRSLSRSRADAVEIPFPPNAPAGRYTLALKAPDGRTAFVEFNHTP